MPTPAVKTLDELLLLNGHQVKNYAVIGIASFLVTAYALTYVFTTSGLKYRCAIPECENASSSSYITSWLATAVPYNQDGYPQTCYRYAVHNATAGSDQCSPKFFDRSKLVKCNKWVFETNEINLLNEFDLECNENKWKLALIGSLDGVGALIGTPICAFVSDRFGRKRALCFFSIVCVILGIIRSFSVNFVMYAVLDFFNDFLDFGIFGTSFVLCMEVVSSRHRVVANVIFNLFGSLGYVYLGLLGIYFPNWRWMLRVLYATGSIFFFYHWLAPESARWLLVKHRDAEAVESLQKAIKNNPKTKDVNVQELLKNTRKLEAEETVNVGYLTSLHLALTSWTLLVRLAHSSACWLGIVFLWYGSLQQSVSLSGDKYSNVMFSALAQVPGYALSYLSHFLGHKINLLGSLVLSASMSIAFFFLSEDYTNVRLVLYLLSMIGVTSSYAVIYTSTVAMFPTPLRQSLLAFCSMVGRLGHVLAPQVFQLGASVPLIFGCVACVVAVIVMFLPETFQLDLPDTIKQAESVGLQSELISEDEKTEC